ncbi:MAG TPA: hypothetical protein VEH27_06045 [Methylomirabilota bacterium]|nr:hypothetical protein [Methylomirabilota bacterium]
MNPELLAAAMRKRLLFSELSGAALSVKAMRSALTINDQPQAQIHANQASAYLERAWAMAEQLFGKAETETAIEVTTHVQNSSH